MDLLLHAVYNGPALAGNDHPHLIPVLVAVVIHAVAWIQRHLDGHGSSFHINDLKAAPALLRKHDLLLEFVHKGLDIGALLLVPKLVLKPGTDLSEPEATGQIPKDGCALGIDIGSTTVKVAVLDESHTILFSDYQRHFADIKGTLARLVEDAKGKLGNLEIRPMITGSGGLAIGKILNIPFSQEVVCVTDAIQFYAPQTDVTIAHERYLCRWYRFFY